MMDMETGNVSRGVLNIPNVQDIVCKGDVIAIESRSTMFSNVNFSRELNEIKMDRNQEIGIELD